MRRLAFATCFAVLLFALPGSAALNLSSPTAVGGVASAPWFSENGQVTIITLTNGSSAWTTVHVILSDANWKALDYDCRLSPMETTYFVFEAASTGSKVTNECSSDFPAWNQQLNIVTTRYIPGDRRGFAVFQQNVNADAQNVLIADFTVIDFNRGLSYSANAWHVQALAGSADHNLSFDNVEYAQVPRNLAMSFIAPDDDVTAELILYTLNGRLLEAPPVLLGALAYDDDENALSNTHEYTCFTVVSLETIFGLGIRRENGPGGFPYFVGHVSLFALVHAGGYTGVGNPPGAISHSFGWLLQTIANGGDLNDNAPLGPPEPNFGNSMPGAAAWARPALRTVETVPAQFDADPRGP